MQSKNPDLWNLVRKRPQIDPKDLAEAVRAEAVTNPQSYRERLLIRDCLDALRTHWGEARIEAWLKGKPEERAIRSIWQEPFDEVGYPSIRDRLMEKTEPDEIRQFLEELSRGVRQDLRLNVAGSIALILPGFLVRHTEDIDIVGDVPEIIRNNHRLLDELKKSYGLQIGHVQTHYFPSGWESRVHSFGVFGPVKVYLLDVYDVFLSKLFSARRKDQEDLRVLAPQLEKDLVMRKLKDHAQGFLATPRLRELATDNWRLLYGEDLPQ
ncbi:MAG: DUF6036 family nucleotidyltransferase [Gemmataceae bacterium]